MMKTQKTAQKINSYCLEDFPDAIKTNILSKLPIKDLASARAVCKSFLTIISTYYFSTLVKPKLSPRVILVNENTFSFLNINRTPEFVVDVMNFEPPALITDSPKGIRDSLISSNLKFHGSILGLICLSLNQTTYLVWNPNTDSCLEFPRPYSSSYELFSGIGDAGNGDLEIVRIGVGVGIVFDCFSIKNSKWSTLEGLGNSVTANPTFLGVAQNLMMWAYPSLNPTQLYAYHFPSRAVIRLADPPQGTLLVMPEEEEKENVIRLFVAGDDIWALGEGRYTGANFIWKLEGGIIGGTWMRDDFLGAFEFPDNFGMADAVVGSTSDFSHLLVQNDRDHLLLLHVPGQPNIDFSITLINQPNPHNNTDTDTDSSTSTSTVNSISDTYEFQCLKSIQYHESMFWPWPANAANQAFKRIPKKGFHVFNTARLDEMLKKVEAFNNILFFDHDLRKLSLTKVESSRLGDVVKILGGHDFSSVVGVDVGLLFKLLSSWPVPMIFPVIHILRILILHPDGAAKILEHINFTGDAILMEMVQKTTMKPEIPDNLLAGLFAVTNLFTNSCFHPWLHNHHNEVLDAFSGSCTSSNEWLQSAYCSLILNYAVLLIERRNEEGQAQVLSAALEIAKAKAKAKNRYWALVTIGSLMLEGAMKKNALDFEVESLAKAAKDSNEVMLAEIGADIELLAMQTVKDDAPVNVVKEKCASPTMATASAIVGQDEEASSDSLQVSSTFFPCHE